MKKFSIKATIVAFLLIISLCATTIIILPDKKFSENENRPLTTMPKITLSTVLSGETAENLNSYTSDQMPLRDGLIALKSSLQILSGRRDINGTYICNDGSYIEKVEDDQDLLSANLTAIEKFCENESLKAKYFMPVPTAAEIMREKLPAFAKPYSQKEFIEKAKGLNAFKTIDLLNAFEKLKNDNDLYYQCDHHWTSFAAIAAYSQFLDATGKKDTTVYTRKTVADDFRGTLYSKVLYPFSQKSNIDYYETVNDNKYKLNADGKTLPLYDSEKLNTHDKYAYFLGGNFPKATLSGGKSGGGTLLLIKDSYANCFVPFLMGVYEKVVLIDPRYFVGSINEVIESENIDDALILYSIDTLAKEKSIQLILG